MHCTVAPCSHTGTDGSGYPRTRMMSAGAYIPLERASFTGFVYRTNFAFRFTTPAPRLCTVEDRFCGAYLAGPDLSSSDHTLSWDNVN